MIGIFIHWLRRGGGLLLAPFLANSNERRVCSYELPALNAGTVKEWEREKEVIRILFEREVYGAIPKDTPKSSFKILEEGDAFDGSAVRTQVALTLSRANKKLSLQLLMYVPKEGPPHKTLLTYNLEGNHTIHTDPKIIPSTVYAKRLPGVVKRFSEHGRGRKIEKEHLPIERLVKEGIAVITLYYGDVDPDYDDGFENGAHALFPEREPGSWGSVSAWAWGLSQVTDYLMQSPGFAQNEEVSLFGFSRLGKAALWAAANDGRFSKVIVDSPGKGGAALARRNFGETIRLMTLRFPHWFVKKYPTYAGREEELPVDQHQLLSLIAPRPVLISSAGKDWWSDPQGEKAAAEAAQKIYQLYGSDDLRHVLHHGTHAVTEDEWDDYLDFLSERLL